MYVTKQSVLRRIVLVVFLQLLSAITMQERRVSTYFEKHNCLDRQLHHAALTEDEFARHRCGYLHWTLTVYVFTSINLHINIIQRTTVTTSLIVHRHNGTPKSQAPVGTTSSYSQQSRGLLARH